MPEPGPDVKKVLRGLGLRRETARGCGAPAGRENRSKVQIQMARTGQVKNAKNGLRQVVRCGKSKLSNQIQPHWSRLCLPPRNAPVTCVNEALRFPIRSSWRVQASFGA
jgi:hypothetical protein